LWRGDEVTTALFRIASTYLQSLHVHFYFASTAFHT
jgi:hypothetical protein